MSNVKNSSQTKDNAGSTPVLIINDIDPPSGSIPDSGTSYISTKTTPNTDQTAPIDINSVAAFICRLK